MNALPLSSAQSEQRGTTRRAADPAGAACAAHLLLAARPVRIRPGGVVHIVPARLLGSLGPRRRGDSREDVVIAMRA